MALQTLLQAIELQVPHSPDELYLFEIISMIVFSAISLCVGLFQTGRVDLYRLLRTGIGAGAAFPPSLLLVFYPVSQTVRLLFGTDPIKAYLMIAGAMGVVLSLYGLFKR